ncbi:hypothetical protein [Acanthopleuribacter pedis]|uniref:Lasso RiPP family leader peptide-containing protein n=1 Tax=Acanthopleuribacter pedis TaxID=442870 RepID=A0A8J7U1H6_9BACT|nr:hypothetical protein [Acanthopleuribacter pedis]MBO1318198.1 hypothetical protein [Acanthopleuribacter pedis]
MNVKQPNANQHDANISMVKKPYEKPVMVCRGDVAELTLSGFNAGSDSKATGDFVIAS